ncbi:MAG: NAD(P)-dependent oxidoreductase [Acidobacteria bacterium]|nr:NAD(P)-dependent oxidoreductase [Acidobacteriota bacterium]
MKVLVTGGAGYVGSVLVPELLKGGYSVIVYDSLLHGGLGMLSHFINPNFSFIKGDIRDESGVRDAVKSVDLIIHLAGIVGYPACNKDPRAAEEINLGGTRIVDKVRSKSQPVMFASTGSNYGAVVGEICTEKTPLRPLTVYGRTKTAAEEHLLEAGNVVAFRFATAFGLSPRLRLDLLINDFVYRSLQDHYLVIYERHFKRTFVHVRDIARAFIFAIEHYDRMVNEVFNVGSERMNLSKEDVANLIRKKIDYLIYWADQGEDQDKRNYEVSYEKIRNLGYDTTVSIECGLDELIKGLSTVSIQRPYANA